MNLQELIGQTDLDLNEGQVRAFFLGALTADKPLPFNKALEELLSEAPEAQKALEPHLKTLWDKLNDIFTGKSCALYCPHSHIRHRSWLARGDPKQTHDGKD